MFPIFVFLSTVSMAEPNVTLSQSKATRALVTSASRSFDVCRLGDGRTVHCQHVRGKSVNQRTRSHKTVDRWMAIPCRQLKKLLPEISCKKPMGKVTLGEPQEE